MIRIGQAGIPLSCKGRTNKDGIVYTQNDRLGQMILEHMLDQNQVKMDILGCILRTVLVWMLEQIL